MADAAKPIALALPLPAKTTIAVPEVTPLAMFADDMATLTLTKDVHLDLFATRQGLTAPLQFRSGFDDIDRAGTVPLMNLPEAHASAAILDWDFANWGGLGLTAGNSVATPGLLGDFTPTPLSLLDNTRTSNAGLAAQVKLGGGWVTSFSYGVDITQLDLKVGPSPTVGITSVHGQSYSLSIAKHGLFGASDMLGLSISRPSQDYFGSVSLADAGLEGSVNLLNGYRAVTLSGEAQETDIALGYVTTFFNGALALQANAGYQVNAGGQNGANGVAVLSRAKINF
jgi:hypothetical protein